MFLKKLAAGAPFKQIQRIKELLLYSYDEAEQDHSKTLIFSDVIKIEILFKYSRARAIRTYSSSGTKNLYRATLSPFMLR